MNLLEFIKKTRMADVKVFEIPHKEKLLNFLEAGLSLAEIATKNREIVEMIPLPHLKRIVDARRAWQELESVRAAFLKSLEEKGKQPPPEDVLNIALTPHRVEALERSLDMCPREDYENDAKWHDAIRAYLEIWTGALNLTLKRGFVMLVPGGTVDISRYGEKLDIKEPLADLTLHRWQARRRAEREGAGTIEFEYPISSFLTHIEANKGRLGPKVADKTPQEILDDFVLSHLRDAVVRHMDRKSKDDALHRAATMYTELLKSPPVKIPHLGGFSIVQDGDVAGLAVVSETGKIIAHRLLDIEGEWWKTARMFFVQNRVSYVAIPMTSPHPELVEKFREEEGGFLGMLPVRSAGLSESRRPWVKEHGFEPPVASAIVLARRLYFPLDEWSKLEPAILGLVEYQHDLSEEEVNRYLNEAKGLVLLDPTVRRIPPRALPQLSGGGIAVGGGKRMNPSIKSFDDVKEGMEVRGIVINITRFGAFVNIGLPQEALLHVSEMSDGYVKDPKEILTLGQEVRATVIEVDRDKKRLSLSIRSNPSIGGKRSKGERGRYSATKSSVLRDLDNLFKK